MKAILGVVCLLLCVAPLQAQPQGLYVRDKVLYRAGKPYRGIGANYFSLFSRSLKDENDRSGLDNLAKLSRAGVPFVRFMCGGFWPVDQKLYFQDKSAYFRRLDRVVKAAETHRIGLIPSLFWNAATVPDLMGEPLDQLGNPNSRTCAFIRTYTSEIVRRYRHSPAIWGWEFGNEYHLGADLPNASEHRPAVWPQLGTAATRSERDEMQAAWLQNAITTFARTVRRFDKTRIIETGNAMPRASAWHNSHEKSWTNDSSAQFAEILARDNPDPANLISVHLYPDAENRYAAGATSFADAVGAAQKQARQLGKPLFIGEFGVERQTDTDKARTEFINCLAALEKHRVPLSAFWVFDLPSQDEDWNVDFANDRADFIALVVAAHRRLQQSGKR